MLKAATIVKKKPLLSGVKQSEHHLLPFNHIFAWWIGK